MLENVAYTYLLVRSQANFHVWQSQVEIKHYFVGRITVFEAL